MALCTAPLYWEACTASFKCSPSRSCGCRHHTLGNAPWRCWPGLQATVATHVWTYSTVGHKNPETRSCMGNWNSLTRQVDLPFSLSCQVDLRTHFSTSPPRQVFVNSTTLLEFSSEKMGGVVVVDKTFLTTKCILPDLTLVYLCFLFTSTVSRCLLTNNRSKNPFHWHILCFLSRL